MNRLPRLRVLVRLLAAAAIALAAAGWIGIWQTDGLYRIPGTYRSFVYLDPELEARGYRARGVAHWLMTTIAVEERRSPIRPADWDEVLPGPAPAWTIARAEAGAFEFYRHDIGWPARFVRIEDTFAVTHFPLTRAGVRWVGPVPVATRPLFPGFLLLIAAAYGVLLVAEGLLRIPGRVRTRRRRNRGCCIACGYDQTGLAGTVCPECGVTSA